MQKIKINDNRIEVMGFERALKVEQELYNEAVQILKGTGLLIDDPEVLTKLALHYTKDLNLKAPMNKLLGLTEFENDYYRIKKIMDSLTFPLDVFTSDGKELHIESMHTYLSDPNELKVYNTLKDIAEKMEALELDKNVIRTALSRWSFDWNPYCQDEIQLSINSFRHGIQATKQIKAAKESRAKQLKAKQTA